LQQFRLAYRRGQFVHLHLRVEAASTAGSRLSSFDDIVDYRERWQLQEPTGDSVIASCTCLFASDSTSNNRVIKFNAQGSVVMQFPCSSGTCPSASNNGYTSAISGVVGDRNGNLWVSDVNNDRMVEFNSAGSYLATLPSNCANVGCGGGLSDPGGPAIDANGSLYEGDLVTPKVQKFNVNTGSVVTTFGSGSSSCAQGSFEQPEMLMIDANGSLYVSDYSCGTVYIYNSDGSFLRSCGRNVTGYSQAGFAGVGNTAIDSGGSIYIQDQNSGSIES
jgi:hypothetical protein